MSIIYGVLSIILLISLLVGVVRIFLGPTQADRMLAAQLFGSVGVAILLLQSAFTQNWVLMDVALFLSILASITAIAFVKLGEIKT
jgi:multicomponent Na+:H+ antiporter subunit F